MRPDRPPPVIEVRRPVDPVGREGDRHPAFHAGLPGALVHQLVTPRGVRVVGVEQDGPASLVQLHAEVVVRGAVVVDEAETGRLPVKAVAGLGIRQRVAGRGAHRNRIPHTEDAPFLVVQDGVDPVAGLGGRCPARECGGREDGGREDGIVQGLDRKLRRASDHPDVVHQMVVDQKLRPGVEPHRWRSGCQRLSFVHHGASWTWTIRRSSEATPGTA